MAKVNGDIARIHILLPEYSRSDMYSFLSALREEGLNFSLIGVKNMNDYEQAFSEISPDIILFDYSGLFTDGLSALAIAKEKDPAVPFIFIIEPGEEHKGSDGFRLGAVDFVRRDDPVHIAYAIRRALKEKRMLDDRHTLLTTFKETEEHYRSIMGNLPVGIFRTTMSVPGRFLQANAFVSRIFGFSSVEDMLKISPSDLFADPSGYENLMHEIMEQSFLKGKEIRFKTVNGRGIWCSLTASCHRNVEGKPDWLDGLLEDITEKKEANENIRSNYRFLQTLIDTISSPLFYKDINGIYLGCNRSFAETIAGLPGDEIVGRTAYKIMEKSFADKFNTKDNELIKRTGVQVYEESIRCVDGKLHNFQFNKSTYTGSDGEIAGIVGVMLDITERVETESALIKLNEEMDLILSSIANIIIGVSVEDRITHWNSYAESTLGVKSEDALGKRFHECNVTWDWGEVTAAVSDSIAKNEAVRVDDLKYIREDGGKGLLGLTINPLLSNGDLMEGFIIVGRDITDKVQIENQLLQARKLEAIGQLAAGVAHEISSPLQYIKDNLGFTDKSIKSLLRLMELYTEYVRHFRDGRREKNLEKEIAELEERISPEYLNTEIPQAIYESLEGVERVSTIVHSMKAFAHPGTPQKALAQINNSIKNTVNISRNEWKYDSNVELDLDKELGTVLCFEAELNQVLLNLIINAVDAIQESKIKGLIEHGIIRIRTRKEGEYAVITVADNGIGIPEELSQKIFDPFFTTKDVGKGTGQGLAITYSIIVDRHGGAISVKSEYGKGVEFTIKIPMN